MSTPPPIRTAMVFRWTWSTARSLDEVAERLRRASFYVVRPRGDVLVATSMTRPFVVVFVLMVRGEDGGDLVVVQGPQGWYSEWDIVRNMSVFDKLAGIRSFMG